VPAVRRARDRDAVAAAMVLSFADRAAALCHDAVWDPF